MPTCIRALCSGQRGGIALATAILLPVLLLLMAIVIDVGRMYMVKNKAQISADAALLGAAASVSTIDPVQEAQRLFYANFQDGYLGSTVKTFSANASTKSGNLTITVHVPTLLMKTVPSILGLRGSEGTDLIVTTESAGGITETDSTPLELVLVLDNSYSMADPAGGGLNKMDALKKASKSLIDILFGANASSNKLHISIVPYDVVVNIGTGHSAWMQDTPAGPTVPRVDGFSGYEQTKRTARKHYDDIVAARNKGFAAGRKTNGLCGPYLYIGRPRETVCICRYQSCDDETGVCEERVRRMPTCDGIPNCNIVNGSRVYTADYVVTCYPDTYTNVSDDPPITDDKKFTLPFETTGTDSRTLTYGEYLLRDPAVALPAPLRANEGSRQAPYTANDSVINRRRIVWISNLAPALFATNNKAAAHLAIDAMRVSSDTRINIGLMWGWFMISPKWAGLWDASQPHFPAPFGNNKTIVLMTDGKNSINVGEDNTETQQLCSAAKAQGITIYTVGFGVEDLDEDLLKNCASQPHYYFHSPTAADLERNFKQIADIVNYGSLRLSH